MSMWIDLLRTLDPAEALMKRERKMIDVEILEALSHLKVQTGSLACMGCGYEHMGCALALSRASGWLWRFRLLGPLMLRRWRMDIGFTSTAIEVGCIFTRAKTRWAKRGESRWMNDMRSTIRIARSAGS